MRVFGLIGYPLTHSFSGNYFGKKFDELGLTDHEYRLFPRPDLNDFSTWVRSIDGLVGLNVTIPYKKSIIPFLDELRTPNGLQACNCIHIESGRLVGYNTDVIGFRESLKPLLQAHHKQALILGDGGAAEAVRFALQELQISYKSVVRNRNRPEQLLLSELTTSIIADHTLIINTTPLGTFPKVEEFPLIPYEGISTDHLLYDLVYNPARTLFLQKGEEYGAIVMNGLDMLVLQAEAAWAIWNR
jgi:shikimate dehydrogenase